MNTVTGREILNAIGRVAEVEWGRCGLANCDDSGPRRPPFTVWRLKSRNAEVERIIQDAVGSFTGNVAWEVFFTGRNWVLAPTRIRAFQDERAILIDVEAMEALAAVDPNFVNLALADHQALAERISLRLQKQKVEGDRRR